MKRPALFVAAFVLGALLLVVVALVSLGGTLFTNRVPAVVVFEGSVRGLYVGAPVTLRGVRVGEVTSIGLQLDAKSLATSQPVGIVFSTDSMQLGAGQKLDIAALVRRGLRAKLAPQSFVTGQMSIDLDFKPDTPLALHGGYAEPEIPTLPDQMNAFIQQLTELPLRDTLEDLRLTLQQTQATLKTAQATMHTAGQELQSSATQLRLTLAAGQSALAEVQVSSRATLASVEKLSDTTRLTIESVQPELLGTITRMRQAAEAAQQAAGQLASLAAPGSHSRENFDSALNDLAQAARSFKHFSEILEDQPNALLLGTRQQEAP